MLPVRRYWCDGVTEGEWVSSAKFAVFQVKRPGMRSQQVAPSVAWQRQLQVYHHGQGKRQAGQRKEGGLGAERREMPNVGG